MHFLILPADGRITHLFWTPVRFSDIIKLHVFGELLDWKLLALCQLL